MSKYFSEDAVLGFLESYDSEEKEISDLDSISTDDGKEDVEEISLCDSSSEEEMNKQPCFYASASYLVSKIETRQTTPFANKAGRAAAHNVIRQSVRTDEVCKISVLENK